MWFNGVFPILTVSHGPSHFIIQPKLGEELQLISQEDGGMLDLEIHQLAFTHHSLFSAEHVLASQLKELFKTYSERMTLNVTKLLKDRLEVRCVVL